VFSSTSSLATTTSVVTAAGNSVLTNGNAESAPEPNARSGLSTLLRPGAPLENGSYLSTVASATTTSLNGNAAVYSMASTAAASTTTTTTTTTTIVSLIDKPPMMPNDNARSTAIYRDQPASGASPPTRDKLRAEDKARRRMNQQGERTSIIGDAAAAASGEKLGRYPTRNAVSLGLLRT